jgi:hypothetical protein
MGYLPFIEQISESAFPDKEHPINDGWGEDLRPKVVVG